MEGLFMPIFQEIQKLDPQYRFHVLQFTWANQEKIDEIKKAAEKFGIKYTAFPIFKKPVASMGSFFTLFTSSKKIENYITENNIDIVMPRSTFPAFMVNKIRKKNFKIIFDADGLPIEERVDFAGLKKKSFLYKFLKSAETKMLQQADAIITRSQKSIDIHLETVGKEFGNKFSVVFNGRDKDKFTYNPAFREKARKELGLQDEFLFVYAGSLGLQYCLPEMLEIFEKYVENNSAKFLILTGNVAFAEQNIPQEMKSGVVLKSVSSDQVPYYLNAADVAFGLRQPSFSMQGVAPIKLGEYLLCGLPVIASKGIGDTEEILKNFEECYLFDHKIPFDQQLEEIIQFINAHKKINRETIRTKALRYFSLESAAESYLRTLASCQNLKP